MEGRRLAVANEIPADRYLDVAALKDFTGGDFTSVRALYQGSRTIVPTAKFVFVGQHEPRIQDANDTGLRERLLVVKFTQTFTGDDCDPELKYRLLEPEALTGLLTVLVEECMAWQKERLIVSDAMEAAKQEYFDANNFIQEFISENCIFGADKSCSRVAMLKALRFNFRDECEGISDIVLTKMICRQLAGNSCEYKRRNKSYRFLGIGLSDASDKDTDDQKPLEEEKTAGEKLHMHDHAEYIFDPPQDDGYSIPDDD